MNPVMDIAGFLLVVFSVNEASNTLILQLWGVTPEQAGYWLILTKC